jgi:hypothetical protein
VIDFAFSDSILEDLEENPRVFVGTVIDISDPFFGYSADLNVDLAKRLGVSQGDLSVQVVEEHIRKIGHKHSVKVIALVKDEVQRDAALLNKLRPGRIILLK